MVGRIAGAITAIAVAGALLTVPQTSLATDEECGPVTLSILFPGLDDDGNPVPTTTPGTDTGEPPSAEVCRSWVYELSWPLGGEGRVISAFGSDRDGGDRKHKGVDIVAPKLSPVLAVADGTVSIIHNIPGEECCWVALTHADGWESWYIHLNNDSYLTDDGVGLGVRVDLAVGSAVEAGDVIGWVGDSGNAEEGIPHLHFELRDPDGYAVDAGPSVMAARSETTLWAFTGPYRDQPGRSPSSGPRSLASYGVLWSCDQQGLETCPSRLANATDLKELVDLMTGMNTPLVSERQQRLSFQSFLPAHELPLVLGCEPIESCLETGITAGDIARLADWVFRVGMTSSPEDPFELVTSGLGDVRTAENMLRFNGVIGFCDPGVDDEKLLPRSDVADYLLRWIWGIGKTLCYDEAEPTS